MTRLPKLENLLQINVTMQNKESRRKKTFLTAKPNLAFFWIYLNVIKNVKWQLYSRVEKCLEYKLLKMTPCKKNKKI